MATSARGLSPSTTWFVEVPTSNFHDQSTFEGGWLILFIKLTSEPKRLHNSTMRSLFLAVNVFAQHPPLSLHSQSTFAGEDQTIVFFEPNSSSNPSS
jgi:hypothetical protein